MNEESPITNGDSAKPTVTKRQKTVKTKGPRIVRVKREQISSEALPKHTLEDSLKVPVAIKDNYGKNGATWEQIANAIGISALNATYKYSVWSAMAYGIITKDESGAYKVSETGRKILAPTSDGEDKEGIIKAVTTPRILAQFYSDYSSSLLPQGEIFRNVLEQKYGIPKGRVDEAINLIVENARFAKLLEEQADGKLKLVSANAAVGVGGETDAKPAPTGSSPTGLGATLNDETATDYKKSCFVITAIGEENSLERKHSDALLRHLIAPVLEEFGIRAIRADKIGKPGHMTKQMAEHIAFCRLCVTDISFGNPNAHYELGIRHTLNLPAIQIVRKGDKIPFDIQQGRTIIIDTSDPYAIMDRFISARAELAEHVRSLLANAGGNETGSPIAMYLPGLSVKFS